MVSHPTALCSLLKLLKPHHIGLKDLRLIQRPLRSTSLTGEQTDTTVSPPAMGRVVMVLRDDLEPILEKRRKALDGEDCRLVWRGDPTDVNAHEKGAVTPENPPYLLQALLGVGHMVERIPTDHQVSTLIQQREVLDPSCQIQRPAYASGIVEQHTQFLIDVEEWVNRDLHGCGPGRQITGTATANTQDRLVFQPQSVPTAVTEYFIHE
jgi:hypothetical protein